MSQIERGAAAAAAAGANAAAAGEAAAAPAAGITAAESGAPTDSLGPQQVGEPVEVAPADGIAALLQLILAGQQQQQQQILALQQKQQHQPVLQHHQQVYAPPANAVLAHPAGGIIPHPLPLPTSIAPGAAQINPIKSSGAKATEKRLAELWKSSVGPKYVLLGGGFDAGRGMDLAHLQMLTKNKAHVTEQAAAQISALWACKVEYYFPPMAHGAVPTARPAQVHLATMVEVFMSCRVRHGGGPGDLCGARMIRSMRRELKLVVKRLNSYIFAHYTILTPFKTEVRNLLAEAINDGMNEGFHELAVQADEL